MMQAPTPTSAPILKDALSLEAAVAPRLLWGALAVAVAGSILMWLALAAQVPWGDSGGYENMLRYFLATGQVDYMRWSQPTFIGLLPVAGLWSLLFGTSTASLQGVSALYAVALIAGLYVFLLRHVRPAIAAVLCLSVFCFPEFVSNASSFMTDVPYACYLVWFLVVHQKLAADFRTSQSGSQSTLRTAWWAVWALLFALASLTRSFTLLLVPFFGLQMLFGAPEIKPFARRCLVLSGVMSVGCLVLVRLMTRNGFSFSELTVVPDLMQQQWGRLNLRILCLNVVFTAVVALPALMLCKAGTDRKLRALDFAAGLIGLALAIHFWRKGLLEPFLIVPGSAGATKAMQLLQIALTPIGIVLLMRAIKAALEKRSDGVAVLLVTVIVAHFAVLPIMQHPLLRHVLPAFICLLMLVAVIGVQMRRSVVIAAAALAAVIGIFNVASVQSARRVNAVRWNMSQELLRQGVKVQDIDGGWAWFCRYHLQPGTPNPQSYVTRYNALTESAPYVVTDESTSYRGAQILRSVRVPSSKGETIVRALKRKVATSTRP